jgi:hypothetical protein
MIISFKAIEIAESKGILPVKLAISIVLCGIELCRTLGAG